SSADVFGIPIKASAADSSHLIGALITTISVIAWAEVARAARYLNVLLALWLVLGSWFLAGGTFGFRLANVVSGILIIGMSLPRGKVQERYGRWDAKIV